MADDIRAIRRYTGWVLTILVVVVVVPIVLTLLMWAVGSVNVFSGGGGRSNDVSPWSRQPPQLGEIPRSVRLAEVFETSAKTFSSSGPHTGTRVMFLRHGDRGPRQLSTVIAVGDDSGGRAFMSKLKERLA